MMPSYSPLFPSVMPFYGEEPIFNIIMNCFEPANMMVLSDPRAGKYISVYMGFRGDIPTNRISSILTGIKSKKIVQFVDWTPTGSIFKFARRYPVQLPGDCLLAAKQSCCGLSNNTAFGQVSDRIIYKFDRLF
jgi:tubulin alpha